jgi:hypothetical protein
VRALGFGPWLLGLTLAVLVSGWSTHAEARRGGIAASGCEGCHGGAGSGKLTLTSNPATITPGQQVELTLSIIGNYKVGGVYLNSTDVGELAVVANSGLTKLSSGLVHNQPKPASNGTVTFTFNWTAPATAGNVRFNVYALGGNGNGASSGDNGIDGTFDFVYGCDPKTYYLDGDGDGVGRADFSMIGCADKAPMAYAEKMGDCDDYRKTTFPGAPELCNMRDDNCDGQVDENAVPVELWPDADGDGYYDARTEKVGEPKIGCAGIKGWAAEPGDCKPMDAKVHAGAEETCNNIDDDCDGDVDERTRPTCGEGWCRRESAGCDAQYCTPGDPIPEKCNFLDDDCDGLTDEDPDMCPEGEVCAAGSCVDASTVMLDPMNNPGNPTPSTGGSGTSPGTAGSSSIPKGGTSSSGKGGTSNSSGGSGGLQDDDASGGGCALGTRGGHGALALLTLAGALAIARRRRAL